MTNVGWNVVMRTWSIVQHGINQHLQTYSYLTAVSLGDCQSGVIAAGSTFSFDCNPFGIDSQVLCVREEPVKGCIVIVERNRKMCFRGKAVINGHGHTVT